MVGLFCHHAEHQGQGFIFSPASPFSLSIQPYAGGLVSRSPVHISPILRLLLLNLDKVFQEEAQVMAILPWQPQRGWFTLVLLLLFELSMLLPEVNGLLLSADGVPHPDLYGLCLTSWRLSGDLCADEVF